MTAISEQASNSRAMPGGRGRRQSGFTLIELMIVVGVLAILAGLAYASYENATTASRRKAGASCLLEASQFMERYYTTNLTYLGAVLPALGCQTDLAGNYTVALAAAPAATTYSLTATPLGRQASKDTKCGTLTLNQSGTKGRTGTAGISECW